MKHITINGALVYCLAIVGLLFSSINVYAANANTLDVIDQDVGCFSREEAVQLLKEAIDSGDEQRRIEVEQQIMNACGVVQTTPEENKATIKKALQVLNNTSQKMINWPLNIFFNKTGNTHYEELRGCGYHPQRREGTCTVEVKRRYGYGGVPAGGPGSQEWVAFCVFGLPANPFGWTLQNVSAVHVHDEPFGWQPSWYYTVTDQAESRLHATPVNGMTYLAKSILSWNIRPNNCFFNPVWGNEAYYRIKLDP